MDISEFTLRLIILLLPGIVAAIIIDNLTVHRSWSTFLFTQYAIVMGLFSYLMLQITFNVCAFVVFLFSDIYSPHQITFWNSLFDSRIPILITEIVYATILSAFLALIYTKGIQKKWLFRLAKKLKISDKYGDENLYLYFLNAEDMHWVWVRDEEKKITYEGLINTYAENDTTRELVLSDVKVFSSEKGGELIYEVPGVYLSLPISSKLVIELPIERRENNGEKT